MNYFLFLFLFIFWKGECVRLSTNNLSCSKEQLLELFNWLLTQQEDMKKKYLTDFTCTHGNAILLDLKT